MSAYLKVSNKLRKQLLNAVSQGAMNAMDLHCEMQKKDYPPDQWSEEETRKFDLISEVESLVIIELERALTK